MSDVSIVARPGQGPVWGRAGGGHGWKEERRELDWRAKQALGRCVVGVLQKMLRWNPPAGHGCRCRQEWKMRRGGNQGRHYEGIP